MFSTAVAASQPIPPSIRNEPVLDYCPGSPERQELAHTLQKFESCQLALPLVIAGKPVETRARRDVVMPHRHRHVLASASQASHSEVRAAIDAACRAGLEWARTPWTERAAVFLRAADLLAGPWRARMNAATMLGQSKTIHQAEIDAAAELCDFFRFNVAYMHDIQSNQPMNGGGVWNRMDYRPLEGFVYAISPFNFTSIAGNLPTAPAIMGNSVVWKPASTAIYSAHFIMELLSAAGLPDGVINLVYGPAADITETVVDDPRLAGIHFTGSTDTFNMIWQTVAGRIGTYRTYPRLVGETGGKNFILAHASADLDACASAIIRGAFEYQGQKCSAASRLYIPDSLWIRLRERLLDEISALRVGDVTDYANFMGAVIDEKAFLKYEKVVAKAAAANDAEVLAGRACSGETGYFVPPTLLRVDEPRSEFLAEEYFLPIAACYVYKESRFEEMLEIIDRTSGYALTGAIFSTERAAIERAETLLRHAAGNFYINDKPTGAVVGQQPFGGGRRSGTNDKAGSLWNLVRWMSPRCIKENFVPARDWRYPFLAPAE